jgi:protein-disulfide isomerase
MDIREEEQKLKAFYKELDQMTKKINDPDVNFREFVFFDNGTPYVTHHVDQIMKVYEKYFLAQ